MSGNLRRRFWEKVSVAAQANEFALFLDGRPLRLPGGAVLRLPTPALAEAVAEEWRQAGGGNGAVFGPEQLALTQLAGTLQERVAQAPEQVAGSLLAYASTDLLCYRAVEPARLAERQEALWQPWLDWLHATHGVRLLVTAGVMPVAQEPSTVERLGRVLSGLPAATLTGLGVIVPELGSLVLGLAVAGRALSPARAVELARLDHDFQAELWGQDAEAALEVARLHVDVAMAARFMELAGTDHG